MKVLNKKTRFNYEILEKFEAGIVLTGAEVKAAKKGRINISQAHAKALDGEIYLINANISAPEVKDAARTKKLLLHKKEIVEILSKLKAKALTLVPISVYTRGRLVKAEIALAKPKRKHQKKAKLKARDIDRDTERQLRPKE